MVGRGSGFFSLVDGRHRIASYLHVDTLEELTGILQSPALRVREMALGHVDLILFIHVIPRPGARRRVVSFWEADGGGGHREVFRWNEAAETFEATGELHERAELERYRQFIQGLVDAAKVEMGAALRYVVRLHRGGA